MSSLRTFLAAAVELFLWTAVGLLLDGFRGLRRSTAILSTT
jgi:hypothetical protein